MASLSQARRHKLRHTNQQQPTIVPSFIVIRSTFELVVVCCSCVSVHLSVLQRSQSTTPHRTALCACVCACVCVSVKRHPPTHTPHTPHTPHTHTPSMIMAYSLTHSLTQLHSLTHSLTYSHSQSHSLTLTVSKKVSQQGVMSGCQSVSQGLSQSVSQGLSQSVSQGLSQSVSSKASQSAVSSTVSE